MNLNTMKQRGHDVIMAGQKITRRQKDISRLLRERKHIPLRPLKKTDSFPRKKNK